MSRIFFVFSIITILFSISSCSSTQKIETLKPEPDDANPLVYENSPSFINIPISVKLKEIESQTNSILNGLIYVDSDIEDDNIEMKIWKQAPIKIEKRPNTSGEKIKTTLPLKAIVKYRIGTKKLGVELYNTQEFNLNGIVTLNSDVSLNNWQLRTKTEIQSLTWNESPTMVVFGENLPVTYAINPAISLFKAEIEKSIDIAIEKSMDFKPNVLAALEKICIPFQMDEAYNSWLRIVPIEIYSTEAKLKNDTFILDMGMKCNMETIVGNQPETKFNASKISLKPVTKIPSQVTANIAAISTYKDASKIITKNFSNEEFVSGGKKIIVKNVTIWHKNGKMVIALDVLGSVNGTLYLNGFPQYNSQTKEIYFDQLDYVLDTKSTLLRTANWLASGYILNKIKESCRYSIQSNLDEGRKSMESYLKNYSPLPCVFVNGTVKDIDFQKIQLTNQAIIAFIKINGTINISVDGLK